MGSVIRLDDARRRRAPERDAPPAEPGLDDPELAVVVEVVAPDLVHLTTTQRTWALVGPALQNAGVRLITTSGEPPARRPTPTGRGRRPGSRGPKGSRSDGGDPSRRPGTRPDSPTGTIGRW
jgi:hypothetical protein